LIPVPGNGYISVSGLTNNLVSVGDILTFSATGAGVPAFTVTVPAPSIDLQSPALPSNMPFALDRGADLVFTWNSGGVGDLGVSFTDPTYNGVSCAFPAAAGTGTIPKAAFAALAPSSAGVFSISAVASDVLETDGWTISMSASRPIQVKGMHVVATDRYQASN
jgi:hypothetical protein